MSSFGTNKVIGMIAIIVVLIVGLACTPVVVDQVDAVNTTEWDFTGYQGAIALLGLVPFIWVAGLLISSVVAMFSLARGRSD